VGEGLFFAGLNHVVIRVLASQTEAQLITTNPQQLEAQKEAQKQLAEAYNTQVEE
jgi:conjugal transfer ATP-binding protein TraC